MNPVRTAIAGLLLVATFATASALAQGQPDPELREVLRAAAGDTESFTDRFEAEVWLTDMSRRLERQVEDPEQRVRILKLVHLEADRAELPPELILAVIETESNFDPYAISVAGAIGLMQIMRFWKDEIGRPNDNLLHIETNLRYGCTILKFYLDKENGDLRRALGRYNGSLGSRKYPNKVIDKLSKKWFQA
ncbi:MAG: lytic transglycosylase domain-containing protein [Woeseiaceae bacterium]|jgi:soluble lytic murein transglycosylase-like protein|nr:lytic transglycosylase domain-containing protein [Woeseiaceae bacterium]TFG40165.1 MAG: lytic transglycosylase domain-containing protein [Chromatiales bacterium]